MHQGNFITAGKKIGEASKALIMVHGRGGSAEDILSLSRYLDVGDYALAAPQATNHTWYPLSFMAPPASNEPWLSSAIQQLAALVASINEQGIPTSRIYLLGFSQGACLSLEFAARHAARYGGIAAFTGGLIGDRLYTENYSGDFGGTPVFIGTSDPDPHVPPQRVNETTGIFSAMNARVTERIYPNMGHTISQEEIDMANKIVFV
ncbi:MAG TPA: dienelactone hydrolase family protein [Flavisolibacter sp.]|nr:dienelactone hydrolase family protein [Flavisolibacter sp.]